MLVKGILLFAVLVTLLILAVLAFEYFLWMGSLGRLLLLIVFLGAGAFLLYKYIGVPLLYLVKVRRGITNKDASLLIGKHFPQIEDRLYNLLDLVDDKNQSELLLASIEQRSMALRPIPFHSAVDYKENLKYIKYLVIPIVLVGVIWLTGNLGSFFGSYERVVNYDLAFDPPAPFRFHLLSSDLDVLEDKSYTIQLTTKGDLRPDAVNIVVGGNEFILSRKNEMYEYKFMPPFKETDFYFVSGKIRSKSYHLNVLKTPSIINFQLVLNYPNYTKKKSVILKSTGNAILPEGTKVTWRISGENTNNVHLTDKDTIRNFNYSGNLFSLSKQVFQSFDYRISTSNDNVKDYEKLDYKFKVIKDAFPSIKVEKVLDSLNPNVHYYLGESSDDYSLTSIRLVCHPEDSPKDKQIISISNPGTNFAQFYYTFPSGLDLEEGKYYNYYFLSTDNDALHNGKSTKSKVFGSRLLNIEELKNRDLESQKALIDNLDKNLEKFNDQKETLRELNKEQKEKEQLNYNEQSQIKDFLQNQMEQEGLMEKFSKQLRDNLNRSNTESSQNKLLQERLERQELEAKRNERLLEELNKITDKINKEELSKKLEELGKKQQNSQRNLEQLLELTKRYYVTEKGSQLAEDLDKLAEDQESLSEMKIEDKGTKEEQRNLNEKFDNITKELDELEEDNKDLKKPIELQINKEKKESIKQDQEEALEEIDKNLEIDESSDPELKEKSGENAKQKQKSAAEKMREMAEELDASSAGASGGSSIVEDAEMLRQILDNLITFSFKQENLFDDLENDDHAVSKYSKVVREQKELRNLFEHVDDSLFALSLRRAELSEFVNEQITDVYYNIDKSLENFSENLVYQSVSHQKYVLNSSNNLADFLANILDNMQQSMSSGTGSGSSQDGFQLPDIIKGQSGVKDQMKGMQPGGEKPDEKEGKEGKAGEKGEGQKGENGSKSDGNAKGESGEKGGTDGSSNSEGTGKSGKYGQGEPSESELREIYEIYKEQQQLRHQLEEQLQNMINNTDRKLGEKLIKQMEDFENDLLENGITQRTLSKVNTIEHELLKLENATLKKGKKAERQSNTNIDSYKNPILTRPSLLDNYRQELELLNRQTLPLRQNFQNKVKEYFKSND